MAGQLAARFLVPWLAAVTLASGAQAEALNIGIDRSTRISLSGSADSVIVGNPEIADVTVVDSRTLFVTGKGYGVTEVIVVDALGRTLFQGEVIVTEGSTGAVRVWRGAEATDMACAASCSPRMSRP